MKNSIIIGAVSFLVMTSTILLSVSYIQYNNSVNIKEKDKNLELISLNKDIQIAEQIYYAQTSCGTAGAMQGYFGDVVNLPPEEALKCNEINKVNVWQDENATFHFGDEK